MRRVIGKWSCCEVISQTEHRKKLGLRGPLASHLRLATAGSPMLFAFPTLVTTWSAETSSNLTSRSDFPLGERREDCVVKRTPPPER